jgi:hypothetical protein
MTIGNARLAIFLLPMIVVGGPNDAQVRIHVASALGESVPATSVTLTTEQGGSIDVKQDQVSAIHYGRYTVSVRVPGFSIAKELFTVDQPEQILFVAMKLGVMETPLPNCLIKGEVIPSDGAERVRLLQLFGSYSVDVPVTPGGMFRFEDIECGDYMLVAVNQKRCVGTEMARAATAGTNVHMRLKELAGGACPAVNAPPVGNIAPKLNP